jgi:hypothetical protein
MYKEFLFLLLTPLLTLLTVDKKQVITATKEHATITIQRKDIKRLAEIKDFILRKSKDPIELRVEENNKFEFSEKEIVKIGTMLNDLALIEDIKLNKITTHCCNENTSKIFNLVQDTLNNRKKPLIFSTERKIKKELTG